MNEEGLKVLIVDDMHESITSLFEEAGFIPDYRPLIRPEEVHEIIHEYHGLVIRSKMSVDRELIDRAVNLKFVARAGAGLDKVDYTYVSSKGIKLINAPEGNRDALAEHTVGMLLTIFNKLNTATDEVKSGVWNREANRGWELMGRTVGVYGCGYMGAAFAQRLMGFSCRVVAYDKYKTGFSNDYLEEVSLQEFFDEVEILSIHVPLTSETRFLFDEKYFSRFKNLKFLLNTSRGEVVKLSAVNDLLKRGGLLGAGLDVLENEKLDKLTENQQADFKELTTYPNVILTPHVAGWTFESYRKINEVLIRKLQAGDLAQLS
ncbi:MAG: NAD(P)-dependent oxidoreductase [Marinoscillum sp.]|uniref:NAD(P)-dependent oxidoreductase n=1 Tax=Marinoscillum sp. TaxID=2024838 RepID=UPI0033011BA6